MGTVDDVSLRRLGQLGISTCHSLSYCVDCVQRSVVCVSGATSHGILSEILREVKDVSVAKRFYWA